MASEPSVVADTVRTERGTSATPAKWRAGSSKASSGNTEYEICNETMRRICGPYRVESERWREFRGGVRNFNVAALNITDIRLSDGKVIKDRPAADPFRGDGYFLVLQVDGIATMCQGGREAVLRPGDCTLIDSRLMSVFHIGKGMQQYSFNFRAEMIKAFLDGEPACVCRPIPGATGPGAVLADSLRSIVRNAQTLADADLLEATVRLLAAAIGLRSAIPRHPAAERSTVTAREITAYVDAHIHDLTFTPQDIAAHFNVSLRQLYRIAAGADCTPSALIWQRRLQRAHELLSRSPHLPITEIAFNCGFKDSAHFSRSYRKAFGQAPRVTRRALVPQSTAAACG
jgi:AraC family transcriptional regulator, positive regulator of tynA and feaB